MKLYLMQHGQSNPENIDPDKKLSAQGKVDCEKIGEILKAGGVVVGQIWRSDKARSVETAEIMARYQPAGTPVREQAGLLPMDEPQLIANLLAEAENAHTDTLIVGHLPHLKKLLSFLLTGRTEDELVAFQPGGVVCLNNNADKWLLGWMIVPGQLK
jgi:phosphohistidine phosphatase